MRPIFRYSVNALALLGGLGLVSLYAMEVRAVVIDCNAGGSIQTEIDNAEFPIEFTGTCNEFVSVFRDGTTIRGLSGNPANDVITGGLSIFGATRVRIENLTINGSSLGIHDGAYAIITNTTIANTDNGVFVVRNSGARFNGSTLGPALVDDGNVSCGPLCISGNSFARLRDTSVTGATNNPAIGAALTVFRDSSVELRGGNTIVNTGTQKAIGVFHDSSVRQDNPTGLGTDVITGGIDVANMSYFDLREATVTGNVSVSLHSVFKVGSTGFGGDPSLIVFNGDMSLSQDSAMTLASTLITINGTLTCADKESSIAAPGLPMGTFNVVGCTFF